MATAALAEADRRQIRRALVYRPAECKLGGSSLLGTVRDESTDGVFFALDRDGEATTEDEMPAYQPDLGDLVLLHYLHGDDHKLLLATVRWRGRSAEHECDGLGLQLEDF